MITVVIPSYNSASFIGRAVASVEAQTYADRELVVVDDGSTDASPAMLDTMAAGRPWMRVVHVPNGGAYAARLRGVGEARGEWVTFLDSDDTLTPDALEQLLALTDNDTDIAVANVNVDDRHPFEHRVKGSLAPIEFAAAVLDDRTSMCVYAKLYRRRLFDDAPTLPRHVVQNEDLLLLLHTAMRARSIRIDPAKVIYNYIFRLDSISKSVSSPLATWFTLFGIVGNVIEEYPQLYAPFVNYRLHRLHDSVILYGTPVSVDMPEIASLLAEASGVELDAASHRSLELLHASPLYRAALFRIMRTRAVVSHFVRHMFK